jgi:hypothetical protein
MPAVAPFDDTDEKEMEENVDMGIGGGEEDEDIPIIEYDRDNHSLTEGTIFSSMIDCRNALATFCIKGEYDFFIVYKSDTSGGCMHPLCAIALYSGESEPSIIAQARYCLFSCLFYCICNHRETIIHFVCLFIRCTGKVREEKRWYTQLKTVRPKTQGANVLSY